MLGLRFCARAFSSCGERGPLFIAVRGPLTIAASLVAEHRLQTRRLSSCGSRAQLLRGMWELPRPGLEPVFPALAGRFSTTAPSGKPFIASWHKSRSLRNHISFMPCLETPLHKNAQKVSHASILRRQSGKCGRRDYPVIWVTNKDGQRFKSGCSISTTSYAAW